MGNRESLAMFGAYGLDWQTAIERLKLRGMWDLEIDEALMIADEVMKRVAAEDAPSSKGETDG